MTHARERDVAGRQLQGTFLSVTFWWLRVEFSQQSVRRFTSHYVKKKLQTRSEKNVRGYSDGNTYVTLQQVSIIIFCIDPFKSQLPSSSDWKQITITKLLLQTFYYDYYRFTCSAVLALNRFSWFCFPVDFLMVSLYLLYLNLSNTSRTCKRGKQKDSSSIMHIHILRYNKSVLSLIQCAGWLRVGFGVYYSI